MIRIESNLILSDVGSICRKLGCDIPANPPSNVVLGAAVEQLKRKQGGIVSSINSSADIDVAPSRSITGGASGGGSNKNGSIDSGSDVAVDESQFLHVKAGALVVIDSNISIYVTRDNQTPLHISKELGIDVDTFVKYNKKEFKGLKKNSKLFEFTRLKIPPLQKVSGTTTAATTSSVMSTDCPLKSSSKNKIQ